MKEKLQDVLDKFNDDMCDEGGALDLLLMILISGDNDDKELAGYIMSDETKEEGDDYITDYQCIEMIASTYELEW